MILQRGCTSFEKNPTTSYNIRTINISPSVTAAIGTRHGDFYQHVFNQSSNQSIMSIEPDVHMDVKQFRTMGE